MSKGPMATSETKRGPSSAAGGGNNKRAPSAASDMISSALRLDAREDDPPCPRGGGDGERDPSPPCRGPGTAGRGGAGVKKKLKAKAAAAAAASFDCDDPDRQALRASCGSSHGMFGSMMHQADAMMQSDMNLNDASFDLLHNDLLPQDSFGFNLTAVQSLSFDMADGDGGGQACAAEQHHQHRGRESAGWAITGGVRELPPRETAGDDRHARGTGGGYPHTDAGMSYPDASYQGGLPVTVSSSVEQSTPKRMEHQWAQEASFTNPSHYNAMLNVSSHAWHPPTPGAVGGAVHAPTVHVSSSSAAPPARDSAAGYHHDHHAGPSSGRGAQAAGGGRHRHHAAAGGYHDPAPYHPWPLDPSHGDHPHAPTVHGGGVRRTKKKGKGKKRKGEDLVDRDDSPPVVPTISSAPAGSLEVRHGGWDRGAGLQGLHASSSHEHVHPIHYGRYHYPRPEAERPGAGAGPPRDIYFSEHGLPPLHQPLPHRRAGTSPFRSGAAVPPHGHGYDQQGHGAAAVGIYPRAAAYGAPPPLAHQSGPLKGAPKRAGKELRRTEEVYGRRDGTAVDDCPASPVVHTAPTRSSRRPRTKTAKALGMSEDADDMDDDGAPRSRGSSRDEDDDYRPEPAGKGGGRARKGSNKQVRRSSSGATAKHSNRTGGNASARHPPPQLRGHPSGGPDLLRLPTGRSLTPSQAPGIGWPADQDARLVAVMSGRKAGATGLDWDDVSRELGSGRSAREAHDRWTRYLKPGSRKGQWSEAEDALVLRIIFEHNTEGDVPGTAGASTRTSNGPGVFAQWADLAPRLPGRTGKQIRDRWVNYLNPHINHMPFTSDDDLRLWYGHAELGKRWVEISIKVFGSRRSENHIKNRWYSAAFKKFVAKEFGPTAYRAPPACERREAGDG